MHGAQWRDPRGPTSAFPTETQVHGMVREAARLARVYAIPITRKTVLSHAEVETTLGVPQAQKWDFDYDPLGVSTSRDPIEIGDQLRALIRAEMAEAVSAGRPEAPPPSPAMPVLRRGSTGTAVKTLQRALGLHDDGIFGPATHRAVVAFQRRRQLLPDGVAGPSTWAALLPST